MPLPSFPFASESVPATTPAAVPATPTAAMSAATAMASSAAAVTAAAASRAPGMVDLALFRQFLLYIRESKFRINGVKDLPFVRF